MKTIKLKNTALEVSNICLGAGGFNNQANREKSFELLDAYVAGGGNFIDTASVYGRGNGGSNYSEQVLGEWLKERNAYKTVIIATKGAHYDLAIPSVSRVTKEDICQDLAQSLKTLGLEQIDFYWLHRDNPQIPVEQIIDIMEALVKEGKIRYYGASNYTTERLKTAAEYAKKNGYHGFSAVSNQWSMASMNLGGNTNPDPTLVEVLKEEYNWHIETGMPLVPYTASAKGFFTKLLKENPEIKEGKLITPIDQLKISEPLKKAFLNKRNLQIFEDLKKWQVETGYSVQALSIGYLISQPFQVIPITAVGNTEQLNDIFTASEIVLDRSLIQKYSL